MKEEIIEAINEALDKLKYPTTHKASQDESEDSKVNFIVEIPADISNGNYSTNVAMALAGEVKDSPEIIADKVISKLSPKFVKRFSKIEKAGTGFINFYLNDEEVQKKVSKPTFKTDALKGQKILLEFTDPNPFKQFHIGHVMTNTIGESLSRIYEANGADVKRICYQGDTGLHVAKAIWGITKNKRDNDDIQDKMKFLGDSYVYGAKEYEENSKAKEEIDELNKHLFEDKDVDIELKTYYAKGRKWSLEYFDIMYEILGTKFDKFYLETESAPVGLEVVEDNKGKIFEESEGAIVYKGEDDGLHTRVFVNSKGVPTYETKDLGLMLLKEKDFKYNKSLIVTGNEQNQYFDVVFAAMKKAFPEVVEKTSQLGHGMLRFADGKMSSRTGGVITADELIGQVKKLVEEKIKERDFPTEDKKEIQEVVSISALKYSILKQSIGKDIIFDFDKSISFEGDSGPYLQYAYTRAKSILEKASTKPAGPKDWETTNLERLLVQYPDVLAQSLEDLAPQHLVTYLTKLAGEFNSFYAQEQILDEKDPNSPYKIQITQAVQDTLQAGLNVLGIEVPSKM
jgi:arginyl-tRNA synthetase